jgi:hypothetical protein
MKRLKLVLGVVALMVAIMAASAAPASAQLIVTSDNDDFCDFFDINDEDCFDFDRDNDDFLDVGDVSQDIEQDADSGDIDQDFSVTSTGDNSNQCVSTQGVANTGNAQNALGVSDFGFEDDNGDRFFGNNGDFDIDDSGADIDVGGTNTTDCTSEVNQAASASG